MLGVSELASWRVGELTCWRVGWLGFRMLGVGVLGVRMLGFRWLACWVVSSLHKKSETLTLESRFFIE